MLRFARQMERKSQLSPDVLCEFSGFKMSGFILSPVCKYAARFGHKAILILLGVNI